MAERVKIKLREPFDWHGKAVSEVELKEPTGWQAATIGEPRVLVHNAAVGGYYVELPDRVAKYLEKCVEHESGADVVRLLCLTDLIALKAALFEFFTQAEVRIAAEKLANFASARSESQLAKSVN